MGKSKSGPALFDLLETDSGGLADARRGSAGSLAEAGRRGSESQATSEADSVAGGPDSGSQNRAQTEFPIVELDDERIRFSFTSFTAAIVVFVVLVGALGAFELGRNLGGKAGFRLGVAAGRASYEADAKNEIAAARQMPAATELVEDLLLESSKSAAERGVPTGSTSALPTWVRGHTYVVVQEFAPGSRDDADRAQAYLAERGIDTARVAMAGDSVQLITTQGYNRSDPTQSALADKLLENVKRVGRAYFADRGGYRLEGYFKTLKSDSW